MNGIVVGEENNEIDVKVFTENINCIPEYAKPGDSGFDLKANIEEDIVIPPMIELVKKTKHIKLWFIKIPYVVYEPVVSQNWKLIPTGVRTEIQEGYEIQVRPRSGLALKNGISVLNTPGTVDCHYRGDIGVILINNGILPFTVTKNMKIAQGVLCKVERMNRIPVRTPDGLSSTERGAGGFGHTGV